MKLTTVLTPISTHPGNVMWRHFWDKSLIFIAPSEISETERWVYVVQSNDLNIFFRFHISSPNLYYFQFIPFTLSLPFSIYISLPLSHALSLSLSLSFARFLLSPSLTHTHAHSISLSFFNSLIFSLCIFLSLCLSISFTHTFTHTHFHTFSHHYFFSLSTPSI